MTNSQGELPLVAGRAADSICVPRHVVMAAADRLQTQHALPTIAKTLRDRCMGVPDGGCCWVQESIARRYGMGVDG